MGFNSAFKGLKIYTRGKKKNTFHCLALNTWTTIHGNDNRALEAGAPVTRSTCANSRIHMAST